MKTLYILSMSAGLPRQRAYRRHYSVMVSGTTQYDAGAKAQEFLKPYLSPGHLARVDGVRGLCATPDNVCAFGQLFSPAEVAP